MKYEKQVSLLIDLIPTIAEERDFALKGGTAINLFYKNMPRLSVDLDLVYLPLLGREEALQNIDGKLKAIELKIQKRHPSLRLRLGNQKIICQSFDVQVKIEVNPIIRGTIYPVTEMSLSTGVKELFFKSARMQVVSEADLYGSKICAALDRQHPRDLFDMKLFFEEHSITRDIINAFMFYLISHNRPIAEVINPTKLNIDKIYESDFVGMTKYEVSLPALLDVREQLITSIHKALTKKDKEFLLSFKNGKPNWDLFEIDFVSSYPSIQWKLLNIKKMSEKKRKESFENLEKVLSII